MQEDTHKRKKMFGNYNIPKQYTMFGEEEI